MDVRENATNEKRLIEAESLMDVIREHEYSLATKQGSIDYGMFTLGIQQAVDEQPTIDAVPVVRCKDCKWGKTWKNAFGIEGFKCDLLCVDLSPEAFCSYGVRKEGVD